MASQRRRHPHQVLTAVQVRQIKTPGRHADGGGLYLVIDPGGARRWVLRTMIQGRRRDIGLGSARLVSLAEARETAALYRKTARAGGDPLTKHRRTRPITPTFAEAAKLVHAQHAPTWRNRKHAAQWLATLEQYAFSEFGNKRVDEVTTADVLAALTPIWLTKPETARRVRQRIRAVFDWAKGAGHRVGDNPVDGITRALPRQLDQPEHFEAMPFGAVPAFLRALHCSTSGEITRLGLELLVLTAARTNEVIGARWDEIDFENAIWTVPAARMKARRDHRVPLSPMAVEILKRARELAAGSAFVFPGRGSRGPMSNMAFLQLLKRMGLSVTAHGFRSAFRDWASESTNFAREVCEAALAHTIKNKAEAAYRRSDLLEKRRELMIAWAEFAESRPSEMNAASRRSVAHALSTSYLATS